MKRLILGIIQNKEHPLLQFTKYGVCGATATVIDIAIFYLLALFVFPALGESDIVVSLLGNFGIFAYTTNIAEQIERNFVLNSAIAFIGSNFSAYVLNVWFVFPSDKTSRHREIILFFAVSGLSIGIGIFLGWILIKMSGEATWGYVMKVISSVLINYAGRKYIVFKIKN